MRRLWQRFWGFVSRPFQRTPGRSVFSGAQFDRLTARWFGALRAADEEIRDDLERLRGRSRQLVRDNPHAAAYCHLMVTNVIGPDGIQFQSRIMSSRNNPRESLNDQIETRWRRWGRACTVDGKLTWCDLEARIAHHLPMDGEVFLQHRRRFGNATGYALEWVDPDLIDHTYNLRTQGKNRIEMGVELDEWGAPVAYYRWRYHPTAVGARIDNQRIRVPASDMIHLFVPYRVGATRGVPWFAPVMLRLKMLEGYEEAELVAARTAASKMGFFTSTGDDQHFQPPSESSNSGTTVQGRIRMDAEPGLLEQLPPGVSFQEWSPEHPTTAFEQFERAMLRQIAAGLGVSYASLAGDLSDVNFSSIRAGLLTERDRYRVLQRWLIAHLHEVVYREWLTAVDLKGLLRFPGEDLEAVAEAALWKPRGWKWVDPLKDVKATQEEIALGVNTRTHAAAELGRDFRDMLTQLKQEQDLAAELGVSITGTESQSTASQADEPEPNRAGRNRIAALTNGNHS